MAAFNLKFLVASSLDTRNVTRNNLQSLRLLFLRQTSHIDGKLKKSDKKTLNLFIYLIIYILRVDGDGDESMEKQGEGGCSFKKINLLTYN
jgi:hypothetical protein